MYHVLINLIVNAMLISNLFPLGYGNISYQNFLICITSTMFFIWKRFLCASLLLTVTLFFLLLSVDGSNVPSMRDVLMLAFANSIQPQGNSTFLSGNRSIYGAMILSDKLPDFNHPEYNRSLHFIASRVGNYQRLQAEVPFGISRWGGVYSAPCPTMPRAHFAERGLTWAHYRIWRDFAYIDPILEVRYEKLREQNKTSFFDSKGVHSDTRIESNRLDHTKKHHTKQSGDFLVSHDRTYRISLVDGTRYRGDELLQNDDVLLIFEDDAVSSIKDLPGTLKEELKDLRSGFQASFPYSYWNFDGNLPTTSYFDPKSRDGDIYGGSNPHDEVSKGSMDVVYLGWCEGRLAKPAPVCLHAYAITRFAARKLVHYIEPCGEAVDLQFATLIKNGWLRFRRANAWSYAPDQIRHDFSEAGNGGGFKDFGIFRQCKSNCGSFMNHRK